MGVGQSVRHLDDEVERAAHVDGPAAGHLGEAFAGHELVDQVGAVAMLSRPKSVATWGWEISV